MSNGSVPDRQEDVIQFPDKTEAVIREMCRTELCRPEQDLTAQINELFPTEQSLTQLDSVIAQVEEEIEDLDNELALLVESNASVRFEGEEALQNAHKAMEELEKSIESIRGKTKSSDEIVKEMTRDIKQLDVAKRNLTASITALHHLHILLSGVDSLGTWIERRDYCSISRQLPAILNVLQLFDGYREAEQIAVISSKLERLKQTLTIQLANDLKAAFQTGQISERVTDMCRVAAALEGNVKENFCKWFIDLQLSEYNVIYAENEEDGWLDKIDDRYKWYVRKLTDFERTGLANVFPVDWDMARLMTKEFCNTTKDVLKKMMARRRQDLDWKLLGHAIQHTKMFEALLMKRFPAKNNIGFDKAIWIVFDDFLDVFIAEQEKTLRSFLEGCSNKIRSGAERPSREASTHAVPLPSSADMFLLLKKIITESNKLSSEPDALLKDVIGVVRMCLREYAAGCLTAFLPSSFRHSSNSTTLFNLMREESTQTRLTLDEQFLTCCILATADWCAETTLQLQEKLAQRIAGIDLNQEMEQFYGITNQALAVLVQDVEGACDAALQTITKINWSAVDQVGDESPFVASIRSHLRNCIVCLRDMLSDRRKYFAHLCLKIATQLSHKFIGALFRCKNISTHGAEQLLLDAHSLKSFLLQLPSVNSAVAAKPPTAYVNSVNAALTKAELILKLVMTNLENPEEFVADYTNLLPTSDINEMQKVLEMRGIKRSEQAVVLSIYRRKLGISTDPPAVSSSLTSSVSAASLSMPASASHAFNAVVSLASDGFADSSTSIEKLKRLEKLVRRN
ncbi:hypothetical protein WR25_16331 [Diploscapter pachys]|uniref:Vacuolar protein sorting-associated protein 53 homolog n=1 Tax=Diploscapter pachys TaxID=2018661 RepID=A0A2A2JD61_9BILA|nr:hypothetical protein WR25_16331 [Diploscapter pachys]